MLRPLLFTILFHQLPAAFIAAQPVVLPQSPVVQRITGGNGQDDLVSMTVNWRGDIAAAGNAVKGNNGGQDICFVIYDTRLDKIAERHIGRKGDDGAGQIAVLPDGRYVLAGFSTKPGGTAKTRSSYFGKRDGWLLILNERGETEQEVILGTSGDDAFEAVAVTPDGEIYLAGNSDKKAWLVKLNAALKVVWERKIRYHQLEPEATAATLTKDGHFFVVGGVEEYGRNHLWVAGVDAAGEVIMEKTYPTSQAERGTDIVAVGENKLAITGTVTDPRNRENGFVSLLDQKGVMLRYEALGGREYDQINALTVLHNGQLLTGGGSASFERGSRRISAWLHLLENDGAPGQQQYYGSKLDDEVTALTGHPDGRILAAGTTAKQVIKMRQGWVFQVNAAPAARPQTATPEFKTGKVFYPPGKQFLTGERTFIGYQCKNTGAEGQINLRAVVKPLDPAVAQWVKWPGGRSVILPPVKAGETMNWGIPLHLDPRMPAGAYRFSIQYYQGDTPVGSAQMTEVAVGLSTQPLSGINTPEIDSAGVTIIPAISAGAATAKPGYTVAVWVYPNPDNFDRSSIVWSQEEITVQIKVVSDQPLSKQHFCLEINGLPCDSGAKFDEVKIKGGQSSKTFLQTVKLTEGENVLKAFIRRPDGETSTEQLKIVYTPSKPNLHILSVGVPAADLKYTSKDARDFALGLSASRNTAFGKIFLDTLLTETQTTKTEMLKALRRLQYRYNDLQILPKDLLVIFVSGHGLIGYDGRFRLAASDYDSPFMEETSLDFELDLLNYLEGLPCRKLFFVDACHSGTTSGAGLTGIASHKHGIDMMLSCQADEYSYEDDSWQNGAFTRSLLRGITLFNNGTPGIDSNSDALFDLNELFSFVQKEIPALVEKKKPRPKTAQQPALFLHQPGTPLILFEKK